MRKFLIVLIVLFSSYSTLQAQDSGLSFELHYPLVFENANNQYSETQGIFGGALQYQLTANDRINYGLEYKFDLNQTKRILDSYSEDLQFMLNHINVFTKISLDEHNAFKMYIDGGLTIYKYKQSVASQSYSGFNAGLGFSYDIMERIYIHTNFNYIKGFKKQKQTGFVDTESKQVIRLGLGFKI